MAKLADVFLYFERYIVETRRNWELRRLYTCSSLQETSGRMTEQWGDLEHASSVLEDCWKNEQESADIVCAFDHPPSLVRVIQFRPAWMEQLVLRMAGIPHVVINSKYAVAEATGPLPYLQDFEVDPPAMTGRLPRGYADSGANQNEILNYLLANRGVDLDSSLTANEQARCASLKCIIRHCLGPCYDFLHYMDTEAWNNVNKIRCLRGGRCFFHRSVQARSERVIRQSNLNPGQRQRTVADATQHARESYGVFEHALHESSTHFLLGTSNAATVDVLLWDHLMNALSDVHLIAVLAEFPLLLAYIQHIWNEFFFPDPNNPTAWETWNALQNRNNPFCELPWSKSPSSDSKIINRCFNVACALSSHYYGDLCECLAAVREGRIMDHAVSVNHGIPSLRAHSQRLVHVVSKSEEGNAKFCSRNEDSIRQTYVHNDMVWVTTTLLGGLVILAMASMPSSMTSHVSL